MSAVKRNMITNRLNRGMISIVLDSRQQGVDVPDAQRSPHLVLNLSYKFDPPNLQISDFGIRCTLSFAGELAPVAIPWAAIYGVRVGTAVTLWEVPAGPPMIGKRRGILGLVS